MLYSSQRGDAHNNGDCWAPTCPLCEIEDAAEVSVCDACEEAVYAELDTCEHGETRCDECGLCAQCSVEERRP